MPVEAAVPCTGLCDRGAGYTSSVQITPRSGCWRPVGSATPNGQMGYRGADYMYLVQITPRSQSVRHTTCPLRQPRVARMLLPPPLHPRLRRHPATQRPTAPMARQLIMEHGEMVTIQRHCVAGRRPAPYIRGHTEGIARTANVRLEIRVSPKAIPRSPSPRTCSACQGAAKRRPAAPPSLGSPHTTTIGRSHALVFAQSSAAESALHAYRRRGGDHRPGRWRLRPR